MENILEIQSGVMFDESISNYEIHAHQPYTSTSFNNSDEIRISIQNQDLNLLPSRSLLRVSGRLFTPPNGIVKNTNFVNCSICHLFEEIRYELNAVEIDRSKNVGITTVMKGLASLSPSQKKALVNASWLSKDEYNIHDHNGYFDVVIPLSMILGFAEDYRKIVVNMKHELILTRSRTDLNAVRSVKDAGDTTFEQFKIDITKIEWLMPYVQLSPEYKIPLLRRLEKNKPIAMSFRSWELYEYPTLPTSSKHVWTVKTSSQLEKPRFVLLAFQTNKKNNVGENASKFHSVDLRDVKLFLNSQYYPYHNLNLDLDKNQYTILYNMYTNFQQAYYGKNPEPMINRGDFIHNYMLVCIDCSKQNDSLKNTPVDVRLEIEAKHNFPPNTSAYCLILHDRIVEYNPTSGDIRKLI